MKGDVRSGLKKEDIQKARKVLNTARTRLWEDEGILAVGWNNHYSNETNQLLTFMLLEMKDTRHCLEEIKTLLRADTER